MSHATSLETSSVACSEDLLFQWHCMLCIDGDLVDVPVDVVGVEDVDVDVKTLCFSIVFTDALVLCFSIVF